MSRYRNSQDYIRDLQYTVKALERKVKAFESGEQYLIQQKKYEKLCREQRNTINHLKNELKSAHEETRRVRKYDDEAVEDLIHDYEKKLAEKDREMKAMRRRLEKAEAAQEKEKEKRWEKQQELYAVQTELEDEKELKRISLLPCRQEREKRSLTVGRRAAKNPAPGKDTKVIQEKSCRQLQHARSLHLQGSLMIRIMLKPAVSSDDRGYLQN